MGGPQHQQAVGVLALGKLANKEDLRGWCLLGPGRRAWAGPVLWSQGPGYACIGTQPNDDGGVDESRTRRRQAVSESTEAAVDTHVRGRLRILQFCRRDGDVSPNMA